MAVAASPSARGVAAGYERSHGILPVDEFPARIYVTRANVPEPEHALWEAEYPGNKQLDTANATGRRGIGRAATYRLVHPPRYLHWWGPWLAHHHLTCSRSSTAPGSRAR